MKSNDYTRRKFLETAAATTIYWMTPQDLFAEPAEDEEEKADLLIPNGPKKGFRFAQIGCGNRGSIVLLETLKAGGTLVALCDVDEVLVGKIFSKFPNVPKYKDFRKMIEEMKDQIDGMVIATPDHTHAVAALAAMRLKKAVYVEKPLARTFWECDLLLNSAKKQGVVTQMGNQGHAGAGLKLWKKMADEKAFGEILEAHVWTGHLWLNKYTSQPPDDPVPPTLDWHSWLGPQSDRPYSKAYLPKTWRGWCDFGTGALGNMASHNMDPIFTMFELEHPTSVQVIESSAPAGISYPDWSILEFTFGPTPKAPKGMKFRWYDGLKLPPLPKGVHPQYKFKKDGCMLIGSKLTVIGDSHAAAPYVVALTGEPYGPKVKEAELQWVKALKTLKKLQTGNHFDEWIDASIAKDPSKTGSRFEYAVPLTQSILLGNIALRFPGKILQWDSAQKKFTNCPEANAFLKFAPRKEWNMSIS